MIYTVRQVLADFALLYVTNDAKIKLYATKCLVKRWKFTLILCFLGGPERSRGFLAAGPVVSAHCYNCNYDTKSFKAAKIFDEIVFFPVKKCFKKYKITTAIL